MDAFPHTYYVVPEARHVRVCSLLVFADGAPALQSLASRGSISGGAATDLPDSYLRNRGQPAGAGMVDAAYVARGGAARQAGGRAHAPGGWWALVVFAVLLVVAANLLLPKMSVRSMSW